MNKHLLILLFLSCRLFAFSDNTFMKIKVSADGNFTKVKVLFYSRMTGKEEAEHRNEKAKFIKHIVAKVNEEVVYEIFTGGFISQNPLFKFKFKNSLENKKIKFVITDNMGNIKSKEFDIENLNTSKKIPLNHVATKLLEREEIWNSKSIAKAIKTIHNIPNKFQSNISMKFINTKEIQMEDGICLYEIKGYGIPIHIQSTEKLESIIILSDLYPRSTVAIIKMVNNAIIDYHLSLKTITGKGTVTAIGRGYNGNFYKVEQKLYIPGADMNCDLTSNGAGG